MERKPLEVAPMGALNIHTESDSGCLSIERQFKEVLKQLSHLFKDIRKHPESKRPETWMKFRTYNRQLQEECLSKAQIYLEICQDTLQGGGDITDTPKFLWYAIRKLNLLPGHDLFELLEDSDVVEIYNNQGVQVFRNHRFFDISSYDFPEIFVYPWHELYGREAHITDEIMKYAISVFSGECQKTIDMSHVPRHRLTENFSPEGFVMTMDERYFSPLKSKIGQNIHAVAISKVEVISKQRYNEKKQTLKHQDVQL